MNVRIGASSAFACGHAMCRASRLDGFGRRPDMIDDYACAPLVARAKP
jgi:hypothetical protein